MDATEARRLAGRIDTLLDEVEQSAPPALVQRVEDLLRAVVTMYGAGLERAVDLAAAGDARVVRRLAEDDLLGSLMVLHDLHPDDVDTRVEAALDRVRPYLGSHSGGVRFTGVDEEGVAHLTLEGSCDGCPSSAMTVQNAIEDAILTAAPDVLAVEVQGVVRSDTPILQIQPYGGPREGGEPSWVHVDVDVPAGTVSLAYAAGEPFLVAGLEGTDGGSDTLVAYLDPCPVCGQALHEGALEAAVLTCASCAHRFDVRRAGRPVDLDSDAGMVPVPLLPDESGWRVSMPERVGA